MSPKHAEKEFDKQFQQRQNVLAKFPAKISVPAAEVKNFLKRNCYLPKGNETAAISYSKPKTAALCYDRVWDPIGMDVPDSCRFSGTTGGEFIIVGLMNWILNNIGKHDHDLPTHGARLGTSVFAWHTDLVDVSMAVGKELDDETQAIIRGATDYLPREVARHLFEYHKLRAIPIYKTKPERDVEYAAGNREAAVATLSNLRIVDEEKLTWSQVIEFREDKDARKKYRCLLHWLDKEMVGKSQAFIEDEIAMKLENYEWALKKHGIKTVLGTVSDTLDGKYLIGVSAVSGVMSLTASPLFGILAGAGLVVGKVGVQLAENWLEFKEIERGRNSEIAVVYEMKKLQG